VNRRIEARRLYLRPLSVADCGERYLGWLLDPEVNRYLETRFAPQSIEAIAAFVKSINARDDEHLFGIVLKQGEQHIGNIKVGPVNRHHRLADISLFIGERGCWGQGYAAEAIAAMSRHAFEKLGVRKLSAGMYAPNVGSTKTFLKAGYREESRRPGHYLLDGKPCDILELGCQPGDLR
jgi:RimJ/RimL family protein N-acetyltransferase